MSISEIQKSKLRRIEITYNFEGEWERIRVEFQQGFSIDVHRDQIEAFSKVEQLIKDFQQVKFLRDQLLSLFPREG